MSTVHVRWLDLKPKTLLFEFEANFLVADYEKAIEEAWQLLDTQDDTVFYVAADVSEMNFLPLRIISTVFKAYKFTDPNFSGITFLIGAPLAVQHAISRFQSALRTSQFIFVDKISDLPEMIQRYSLEDNAKQDVDDADSSISG